MLCAEYLLSIERLFGDWTTSKVRLRSMVRLVYGLGNLTLPHACVAQTIERDEPIVTSACGSLALALHFILYTPTSRCR